MIVFNYLLIIIPIAISVVKEVIDLNHSDKQKFTSKEEIFINYPVPKALAKFMIPTVLSQLTFLVLNLADAFFVGRTNDGYL